MSEIIVSPFVDVMLVLLIVFMVSAPLLSVGVPIELPETAAEALTALPPPHAFEVPDVLFAKISDEQREDWQSRFAGVRS